MAVRNIFDQYSQPENRLTHALASCLCEDSRLLRSFIRWAIGKAAPTQKKLRIVEQQLPGEAEPSEEDAERMGLPDAWIHDSQGWSLIIESKVASSLSMAQLRRHRRTAERRGFKDTNVLAIVAKAPGTKLPEGVHHVLWSDVYTWARRQVRKSLWARQLATYMEVAEGRMVAEGYLKEGKLTVFSGVPFDEDNPYNYREAKRVLNLAMDELSHHKTLRNELQIDLEASRRPAITGREGSSVWDFLALKRQKGIEGLRQFPHLTLSIQVDRALAMMTLPHGLKSGLRRNLVKLGKEGFFDLLERVNNELARGLGKADGFVPWVNVLQRRYPTRSSLPIADASLEFDLRTAVGQVDANRKHPVRRQPQWLDAVFWAIANKRSNLQVGVGAIFPYKSCPVVHTPQTLNAFAATWLACKPLLGALSSGT